MWKTYSLQARLSIFLCSMFLVALTAGLLLLRIFATDQLIDENEPADRSTVLIADALNNALSASSNPKVTLDAFADALNKSNSDIIKFRRANALQQPVRADVAAGARLGRVPGWFVSLLVLPEVARHAPIMIQGEHVGDLTFEPDMAADVYEKWIGFLAVVASGVCLMLLALGITLLTVDAAVRPLRDLGGGLIRLRDGHYGDTIVCSGPPEIRESCEAANELAKTLTHLNRDNSELLRKIVSIQDEERRDIARELHDELGPLLFAIRANVVAMIDDGSAVNGAFDGPPQKALQSVEALQSTSRRILDHLRPLYIEDLGLQASIEKLLRNVRSQVPSIELAFEIDPSLKSLDAVVSQTVFRVLQEAITNVLRHAQATQLYLGAIVKGGKVYVEVSDNGLGMPADVSFGRGLTGMRERVRALGGTFEMSRNDGRTYVRCSLPTEPAAS